MGLVVEVVCGLLFGIISIVLNVLVRLVFEVGLVFDVRVLCVSCRLLFSECVFLLLMILLMVVCVCLIWLIVVLILMLRI